MSQEEDLVFRVVHLGAMRNGRCVLTVEGIADVNDEPRKVRMEVEFSVKSVRVRLRQVALSADTDSPCVDGDLDAVAMDAGIAE